MHKIAAIQMTSTPNVVENLIITEKLIQQAVAKGAELIVLPENFAYMGKNEQERLQIAEIYQQGPIQEFLATQAQKNKIWLVGGTTPIKTEIANKVYSSCLVFNDQGQEVGRYDKIHLFDVIVKDEVGSYQESNHTVAGKKPLVLTTPFGRLGVSVCFDLRFPELYRAMSLEGSDILAIPAAFTYVTGEAHWEILLRARAIENLCYVIAAAQGGEHLNGRKTYGHSMIIDSWGIVYKQLELSPGVVAADFDLTKQNEIRKQFPVLQARKLG
jgi:nitrilase